jgi:hypothetical protein
LILSTSFSNAFCLNTTTYWSYVTTCELKWSTNGYCHVFSLLAILVGIISHPIL